MPTADDYARAERLLPHNLKNLVRRAKLQPRWRPHQNDDDRFWYAVATADGTEHVVVDPSAATRATAFDHAKVAEAVGVHTKGVCDPRKLPVRDIDFDSGTVTLLTGAGQVVCDLLSLQISPDTSATALHELLSPDRSRAAFVRDHDLWVRDLHAGEERRLTNDGSEALSYATNPDVGQFRILFDKLGIAQPPMALWSPDSRMLVTHRIDQLDLPLHHVVEAAPPGWGRPRLHSLRYSMPGEPAQPTADLFVLDVDDGAVTDTKAEPFVVGYVSPIMFKRLWWSGDGRHVYWLEGDRGDRVVRLRRLDAGTGEAHTVIEEANDTHVDVAPVFGQKPNVAVLHETDEVVWWSERDGWGHLYLLDGATGEVVRPLTGGSWLVRELLHVDDTERAAWFTASGREEGVDPYARQLYRVSLESGDITRLTGDALDHQVTASPTGRFLVDTASIVDEPPGTCVRDRKGDVVVELERAEVGELLELGWSAPERFSVKAADGATEVWGTLFRPFGFGPDRRYPLVDDVYPGPQINRCSVSFVSNQPGEQSPAMAALGFAVVQIDGRGTPLRDKAFHDASYRRLSLTLEDHVAAISQLGERYPFLDLERTGIYGYSGGGFASVRAILEHPDVFKASVAAAGNHDNATYQAMWGETYLGMLDGKRHETDDLRELARNLEGKLLLIHGELDDNVNPAQTLRLVDALIAADKDFDLLIVPGGDHVTTKMSAYVVRRRWDFLVRHVMGEEPPVGYHVAPIPIDLEALEEMLGVDEAILQDALDDIEVEFRRPSGPVLSP